MNHFFYVYPVNEVVVHVLIIDKDVTENQHTVNLHTQKGICGTVFNCAISAEWRTQKL